MGTDMLWPVPSSRRDVGIDPALVDSLLGEEVELRARLIVAANATDGRLDPATLDAALFSEESEATHDAPVRSGNRP